MKKFIPLIIIMWLLSSLPATAEQPTAEHYQINVIDNTLKAAVSLSNLMDGASGFFVAPNYIITNEHVVAGMPKPVIYTSRGACFENTVVATDKYKDLALIKTDCKGDAYIKLADKVTIGQDAYIVGEPLKLGMVATSGLVAMVKDDSKARGIYVDSNVYKGSSGSPVVNSNGDLIGVVFGKDSNVPNLAIAVHLIDVKAFLQRNGVN